MKKITFICLLLLYSITHTSERSLATFILHNPQKTSIQERGLLELTTPQGTYTPTVDIEIESSEAVYALCALAIESLTSQIKKTTGLNRMVITGAKRGPNKGTLALMVKLESDKEDAFYCVNLLSPSLLVEQIDTPADST